MSRVFLSHASTDNRKAIALRQWLVEQNPRLANEIFLDLDPKGGIRTGERWQAALRKATARCEAVVCLLSAEWESRLWCLTEYRTAEMLNKRVFCVRLEPDTGETTSAWQWCDLFGSGAMTAIDIGDGGLPVEFATAGLYKLRDDIRGAGIGADSFEWPIDDPERSPYRGWQPFEPVDAGIFFGRDAPILRALDAIRGMRKSKTKPWFVVLGPSGTGKSSFLRAGLLPRLHKDDREFLVLGIVRPERDVMHGAEGLATAIYSARQQLGLTTPELGDIRAACTDGADQVRMLLAQLQEAARSRLVERGEDSVPPTLVLPIDQAEELLAPEGAKPAVAFLQMLRDLQAPRVGSGLDMIVAATMRSDRFEGLQTRPELSDVEMELFGGLKPMPTEQFDRVITGPAERATESDRPLEFGPDLVEKLLDDCREGSDTLPLLSLTLARLYENYGRSGKLTLAHYERIGGLRKVVQSVVDGIVTDDANAESQLALARSAFIPWLVTINPDSDQPMRRVARWSELPAASHPIVNDFVANRLLVKDQRNAEVVVEVALESLLRQWDHLVTWLDAQRTELKATEDLERAAAQWEATNRNEAWLFSGSRLGAAEGLLQLPGFRERVAHCREFIDASRQSEDAKPGAAIEHSDNAKGLPTWIDRWRLRAARSITAVLDVDEDALSLVEALREFDGDIVTVVAEPFQAPRLRALRGNRTIAVASSLKSPDALDDLPFSWRKLSGLYLLSADPATNLRRLEAIGQIEGVERSRRIPVIVRIDDPWQAASWRARALGGADPRWDGDAVSKYEVTATQLLDRVAEYERITKLYICGGSVLTLALCAELARRRVELEYYADPDAREQPAVTLIGHSAEEHRDDVRRREHDTVGLADVAWLDAIDEPPSITTLTRLFGNESDSATGSAVIFVDDPAALSDNTLGSRLVSRFPSIPIFVWRADAVDPIFARPVMGELISYRLSMHRTISQTNEGLERAAKLIHAHFEGKFARDRPPSRPWAEVDELYREANRRQVRNVLNLVVTIGHHTWDTFGSSSAPLPDLRAMNPMDQLAILGFDRHQVIAMARAEHNDWSAFYRNRGWTYASSRNDAQKRHNKLVPWDVVESDPTLLGNAIVLLADTILSLRELGYRSRPIDGPSVDAQP